MIRIARLWLAAACALLIPAAPSISQAAEQEVFPGKPRAVVDLATGNGAALVKGEWRYSDTRIV